MEAVAEGIGRPSPPPSLSHLRAFGCRAYALTREVKAKLQLKRKLKERAHIGYLIGYDSTTIFRIWVPSLDKVIRTRDVRFNESLFYRADDDNLTA